MKFDKINSAIKEIKSGKMVVVLDNEDRENEGDLVMASEAISSSSINFMAKEGRGLICVSISSSKALDLDLEPMQQRNTSLHETAFTVSVDAVKGTTTGISASDRSKTIKAIVNPKALPKDLARPGHIFPIIGKEGGVLRRAGHTEASMDLSELAGFSRSGVICEIIGDDGEMLRGPQLFDFAKKHKLKIISIEDLIRFRKKKESLINKIEEIKLPTKYGDFNLHMFEDIYDNKVHFGLTYGKILKSKPVLTRVHSECLTGDIFRSQRCDCGDQLEFAMKEIVNKGSGIIVYLRQEGRGIGLKNKIKAYKIQQEQNLDTVEANNKLGFKDDLREYGVGAQILKELGAKELIVMTNNPKKLIGLKGHDLKIKDRKPVRIKPSSHNKKYLNTKKTKLNHILD